MTTEGLKTKIQTQQSKGIATTQDKPSTIFGMLEKYKQQIAIALPKHMTADRMARIITTEIRKLPELLQCNQVSLFGAVIQCAQLGLEPGNNLGHAYLLPFNNTRQKTKDVQLIIGYRGMLDLARRSGQILSINVYEVFDTDDFEVSFGLNPDIKHKRDIKNGGTGNLIAVYAVAKLKDGGCQFEVMTKAQVDEIRKSSKSGNSQYSPWTTHYNEMAKKTVIRRLFKYLPVSIELNTAIGLDEYADAGIEQKNSALLYPDSIDISNIDGGELPTESIPEEQPQPSPRSKKTDVPPPNVDIETGEILADESVEVDENTLAKANEMFGNI